MAIAVFWLLYVLAAALSPRWSVYLLFAGVAFGTFNVLPIDFNLIPTAVCGPLMAFKVLVQRRRGFHLVDGLVNPRHLGWLTAFYLTALVVTAASPILFAGINTIGINTSADTPLHHGMWNVTQTLYMTSSVLMAAALFTLLQDADGRAILGKATVIGAATLLAAGVLDMVTAGTGLLDPLRTAKYALLTDTQMAGLRRVVGLNTEASSYGGFVLLFGSVLLLARPARFAGPRWQAVQLPMALAMLVMAVLSTSTGTYLGLAVLFALLVVRAMLLVLAGPRTPAARVATIQLSALALLVVIGGFVLALNDGAWRTVTGLLDEVIFQKRASDSYLTRAHWTEVGMQAVAQTYGFGVGLGSTRVSNWFTAVLTASGVMGGLFMGLLLLRSLTGPIAEAYEGQRETVIGARLCWLTVAVPAFGAATSADIGLNGLLYALMAGVATPLRLPRMAPSRRPASRRDAGGRAPRPVPEQPVPELVH